MSIGVPAFLVAGWRNLGRRVIVKKDSPARKKAFVVSRKGYILWSRASGPALRTRPFFRSSAGPIQIPAVSLAKREDILLRNRAGVDHGLRVWLDEPVREMAIFSEQYDFAISLLLLEEPLPFATPSEGAAPERDTVRAPGHDHAPRTVAGRPACSADHRTRSARKAANGLTFISTLAVSRDARYRVRSSTRTTVHG